MTTMIVLGRSKGAAFPCLNREVVRIPARRRTMKAWMSGSVAGTGTFRCTECDSPVSLDAADELPACANCGGTEFVRSSLFTTSQQPVLDRGPALEDHSWLA